MIMPTDYEKYQAALETAEFVYPDGYGEWDTFYTLEQLIARHSQQQGAPMEPETLRRLIPYLKFKRGFVGIGDSWRAKGSKTSPASLANKSFHQDQVFEDGQTFFCAVDLVVVGGFTEAGELITRAPREDEVADSVLYGLHDMGTDEAWHRGPIEIRGHGTWLKNGRQYPDRFDLPDEGWPDPPPPVVEAPPQPEPTPEPTPDPTPNPTPESTLPEGQHMITVNVTTLKKGLQGERVEKLQAILNANFTEFKKDHLLVDGEYGSVTEKKVKDVQKFFGMEVDGICGPKTWEVVMTLPLD